VQSRLLQDFGKRFFMSGYNSESLTPSSVVLDDDEMRRAWTRVAHEILERNHGVADLVLIGILRKGWPLAERLKGAIQRIEGQTIPSGVLDISLYRDDFRTYQPRVGTTNIPFDIEGKKVVLVDDVLSTGRTVRAALGALNDLGRPSVIQLAVLVDRGHRELPIRPDFVGKNVPSSHSEFVRVSLMELEGRDIVEIFRQQP
jgi:pyrimidine operon attenuation protein/uracil phosphoribosyltransferase